MTEHNEQEIHNNKSSRLQLVGDYLGELVYGGIDGSVTTFAVVSGSVGAGLDSSVILILGGANLLADGLAMSIGAYLSTKTEQEAYNKHLATEYWEVDNLPEVEREEIREIYEKKGFEGKLLEDVVDVITADKDRWVDVMMKEELEMQKETKNAIAVGLATYTSFLILGIVPLLVYVWDYFVSSVPSKFNIAVLLTSLCFITIGYIKSHVNHTSKIKGVLETLILGSAAAFVSYFVGDFIEGLLK